MTNNNDRLIITAPEGSNYVDLPAHSWVDGRCTYCGDAQDLTTYDAYVEEWYDTVYEGTPGHKPWPETHWTYLRDTCLG